MGELKTSLYLVSCVSMKLNRAAPAQDLYISPWFKKARAFVEHRSVAWRILSAKHGLVAPEAIIAPCDQTVNRMPVGERRLWAQRVFAALTSLLMNYDSVVILAGTQYREFLVPALVQHGIRVEVPLGKLALGEQLRWLGANTCGFRKF